MKYTPAAVLRDGFQELPHFCAEEPARPAGIFRELKATGASIAGDLLVIATGTLALPLTIARSAVMTFGDETITSEEYSLKTIEAVKRVGRIFDSGCDRCDASNLEHLEKVGLMVQDVCTDPYAADTLEEGETVWRFNRAGQRLVSPLLADAT